MLGFRTGLGRRSLLDILGAMPSSPMPIAPTPLGTGFVVVAGMLLLPRLRDVDGVYLDRFLFLWACLVLLMSLKRSLCSACSVMAIPLKLSGPPSAGGVRRCCPASGLRHTAENKCPGATGNQRKGRLGSEGPLTGTDGCESCFLQRRVACEPDFRGRIPDAAHHQLLLGSHRELCNSAPINKRTPKAKRAPGAMRRLAPPIFF